MSTMIPTMSPGCKCPRESQNAALPSGTNIAGQDSPSSPTPFPQNSTFHLNPLLIHTKNFVYSTTNYKFTVFNTEFEASQALPSALSKVLQKKSRKIRIQIVSQIQFVSTSEMSNHQDYSSNMYDASFFTIFMVIPYK